jgi:hypothetical protein
MNDIGASKNNSYKNKDALSGTFEHLGECIEVVMTIYVPSKIQIGIQRQLPIEDYTPFHGILSPLICEASKAMTCIDFSTYFIMFLGVDGFVSSY